MSKLEDGTGTGNVAKVDDEGRLHTLSNIIPHPQHHSMTHQNLFSILYTVTLDGTSETNLSFFKNIDSNIDFEFYITEVSSDANVTAKFYFDDEYTSGGIVSTPLNLNRGSGINIPDTRATIYKGGASADLVLDTTNRVQVHETYLCANCNVEIDFQGGLIVQNGKSVTATITGTAGDKISLLAMCSWHDAGTKL